MTAFRATIDQVDPDLGRGPERPVRVIGHSLGGVIAVDIATADVPLWTRCLVTFGSQSPFFHVSRSPRRPAQAVRGWDPGAAAPVSRRMDQPVGTA